MAADSALKRFSLIRLGTPGHVFVPDTSGVVNTERFAIVGLYGGFSGASPSAAVPSLGRAFTSRRRVRARL